MYNTLLRMWKNHLLDDENIDKAVTLNWITEDQATTIKNTPR